MTEESQLNQRDWETICAAANEQARRAVASGRYPSLPAAPDPLAGSVIQEMAARLRNAGLWDHSLGDGLIALKARLTLLENLCRYEGFAYDRIPRPLQSWEDCRRLAVVLTASRSYTFTELPAPINACLNLAVALYRWEQEGEQIPSDIRGMDQGGIGVEWSKPARYVLFYGSGTHEAGGKQPARSTPGKATEAELFPAEEG